MTKIGISVGMLATVFCFAAGAQTINLMVLDQAGAQTVLQVARESVQQRKAPSAIAVVDPAGDLLAFQRMETSPVGRYCCKKSLFGVTNENS
jgi:glc operon protein GlcG